MLSGKEPGITGWKVSFPSACCRSAVGNVNNIFNRGHKLSENKEKLAPRKLA